MEEIVLRLPEAGDAQGGRAIQGLARFLEGSVPTVTSRFARSNADAQDLGTTLVLIAGTPAALALAKGIAAWLVKAGKPAIEITSGNTKVVVEKGLSEEATREIVLRALGSK